MDNMNNEMSLVKLMRDDEDFIKRMETKKVNVKQDKVRLDAAANEYGKKYEKIVEQGTIEKQLLLEDGRKHGLTEDQVFGKMSKYIPAKDTPILNMIYFLLNEYKNEASAVQFLREQKDQGKDYELLRESMNADYGHLTEKDAEQALPDLLEYVYNNVTLDIFNTIKKLKALSTSNNEVEASRAFLKGRKLCQSYNLDWDRIPCNLEDENN